MLNTIGAAFTEFFMLGLTALAVFVVSNAAFGTLGQAPDLPTGLRHLSLGVVTVLLAVAAIITLILTSVALARSLLLFTVVFAVVVWMVMSTAGEEGPAIVLFALVSAAAPALLIAILRRLL